MRINISGRHIKVTDSINKAVHQKFEKIRTHYPQLDKCDVTLTVEPHTQIAEIATQFLQSPINVHARHHDLYVAIAEAVRKLDRKLADEKGTNETAR